MSKTYLLRHYDRIDQDPERCPLDEARKWNRENSKKPLYNVNPYLCAGDRVNDTVRNLGALEGIKFDYVFCSPFLRCIETVIQLMDASPGNFKDKNIFIDYCLSEFIDTDLDPFKLPLDITTIYEHSKAHLIANNLSYPSYTLVNHNVDLTFSASETEEEYLSRIEKTVKLLRSTCEGNILIVSHGYAIKPFNSSIRKMEHGPLYDITPVTVGGFYDKYVKYKLKYLQIKKMKNLE